MWHKRTIRKAVIMLCLVCLLFFNLVTVPANAIAGVDDLVIAGGTVMTLALVSALGMMSINSAGMASALQQAATNAQQNVKVFSQTLFESYARSQNITAGQAVQIAAQGTSYLEDGKIIFDEQMSSLMDGFINWAWGEDGGDLISYADILPVSTITVPSDNVFDLPAFSFASGINNWFYREGNYSNYKGYFSVPVFGMQYLNSSHQRYVVASDVQFLIYNSNGQQSSTASGYSYNGKTVYYYPGRTWDVTGEEFGAVGAPVNNVTFSNSSYGEIAWLMVYGGYTGDGGNYDVNLDVLNNVGAGQVGVFDPDSVISITDAPVGGGTINIDDWLEAIADAIAEGIASIPITLTDATVTDAAIELTAEDAIPVDITAEQEGATDVQDATSIEGMNEYTLDLVDFFPFCIPFDIYDMLSLFAASREAPHFDYRFYVPGVCDETITIDLSEFDSAAQVLRTVELLASAIGLAFITKKLIQGGD